MVRPATRRKDAGRLPRRSWNPTLLRLPRRSTYSPRSNGWPNCNRRAFSRRRSSPTIKPHRNRFGACCHGDAVTRCIPNVTLSRLRLRGDGSWQNDFDASPRNGCRGWQGFSTLERPPTEGPVRTCVGRLSSGLVKPHRNRPCLRSGPYLRWAPIKRPVKPHRNRPCFLDVVAGVGTAVEERRHNLAFLFFWLWYSERWDRAQMLFRERPTVSHQNIAFDLAHRLNCICRSADAVIPNIAVSRQRPRPSAMLSKNCAHSGPSPLRCRSVMSVSTKTKSSNCDLPGRCEALEIFGPIRPRWAER